MTNMGNVEIVRCKDCIHRGHLEPTDAVFSGGFSIIFPQQDYRCPARCEDPYYNWCPDDDWFCANGERKETTVDD